MFDLISSFLNSGWLRVVVDGNSSQEFAVGAGVPQGPILGTTLKKKLYGSFLWMGFNCLKARATSRRQITFYH